MKITKKSFVDKIAERYKKMDSLLRKGVIKENDLPNKLAMPSSQNSLAIGTDSASHVDQADKKQYAIPFTITRVDEDRDGDTVIPMGCYTKNYARNPVIFFGHQSWEVPIGKAMGPDKKLAVHPSEEEVRSICYFDRKDPDAMFIYGKVMDGFLSGSSVAFVPVKAFRKRGSTEKANARTPEEGMGGWVYQEWDMTEWSIVGVPSNAGALRDAFDREKSFISPRCQKALVPFCEKSRGRCFSGYCPPCPTSVTKKSCGCSIGKKKTCGEKCGCADKPEENMTDKQKAEKAIKLATAKVAKMKGASFAKKLATAFSTVEKEIGGEVSKQIEKDLVAAILKDAKASRKKAAPPKKKDMEESSGSGGGYAADSEKKDLDEEEEDTDKDEESDEKETPTPKDDESEDATDDVEEKGDSATEATSMTTDVPTHSAQVLAHLHRHFQHAKDYLQGELAAMDNPMVKEDLSKDQSLDTIMEAYDSFLKKHHPTHEMEKVKAMLDANNGETAAIAQREHQDPDAVEISEGDVKDESGNEVGEETVDEVAETEGGEGNAPQEKADVDEIDAAIESGSDAAGESENSSDVEEDEELGEDDAADEVEEEVAGEVKKRDDSKRGGTTQDADRQIGDEILDRYKYPGTVKSNVAAVAKKLINLKNKSNSQEVIEALKACREVLIQTDTIEKKLGSKKKGLSKKGEDKLDPQVVARLEKIQKLFTQATGMTL